MAGQSWYSNEVGAYLSRDTLSKKVRAKAQPMMRRRQFTEPQQEYGRKNGKRFYFNKRSNVSATLDGAYLSEGVPIPRTGVTISQGTCTALESGRAISHTELFDSFADTETKETIIVSSLSDDMAKQLDYRAYAEGFNLADVVYTPTGSDTVPTETWAVAGTAGATASRKFQVRDLKNIADAFAWGLYGTNSSAPAPPWDGTNFVAVGSVGGMRSIKDDPEWERAQYYGDPEKLFSAEAGKIYGVRLIADNHISGRLSGAYSDEFEFFGADAVMEIICTAEEIRDGIPGDHGRDRSTAWYYLGGFACIWDYSTDGDNRIVRVRG